MKNVCASCFKPKTAYSCELCESSLCKSCAQFMNEDSFSYLRKIPEELSKSIYCPRCFDDKVSAPLVEYNETLEKAKDIIIFFKNEGKKTRLLSRKEVPYQIDFCPDRDEAIMRLSFYAVQDKFNSIIDVDLISEKVISGSHKSLKWKGSAVPCQLDARTLAQDYYD